jgi:hypothetical protein
MQANPGVFASSALLPKERPDQCRQFLGSVILDIVPGFGGEQFSARRTIVEEALW